MRFFTDDGGRRSSPGWTWRNTTVVLSLALVSSLAVGIAAAGGISVLERPSVTPPAAPPLADSSPPEPLPLDLDPPAEPEPSGPPEPRDTGPVEAAPATSGRTEAAEPEPEPVEAVEVATGTWTQVEEATEVDEPPVPDWPSQHLPDWGEGLCPGAGFESFGLDAWEERVSAWEDEAESWRAETEVTESWTPTWDTEYPAEHEYERLSHRPCDPYRRNCRIAVTSP